MRVQLDLCDYLKATPRLNELRILAHLKQDPSTSQTALAEAVGLVPAMVNTYIRRFSAAGLIDPVRHSSRKVDYVLTPEGERTRSFHIISFLSQVYALFEDVLEDLRDRVRRSCGTDPTTVAIYGAGETGRMVYLAIQGLPHVTVGGVVDDDPQRIGTSFFAHTIRSRDWLLDNRPQKLIVASWRYGDAMASAVESMAQTCRFDLIRLIP